MLTYKLSFAQFGAMGQLFVVLEDSYTTYRYHTTKLLRVKNKEPNGPLSLPAQSFLRTASMGWVMSGVIAVSC